MALVHAELYLALRSANVPHELAQEASLADRRSFSSHDRALTTWGANNPFGNFDPAMAKLESDIGCIKVMLFIEFLLLLTILVFT